MTQAALADAAGMPVRTLKAWEKSEQPQGVDTAIRLARALGVTLDELAGLKDPPKVEPAPPPTVVVDGVEYLPASARDAGAASRAGSRVVLEEAEEVALDAEEAARRGREEAAQKRRRSA